MPLTLEQLRNQMPERRATLPGVQRCVECKVPLQETITGNRKTDKGHMCSDCYFRMLSDHLDQHPIFMPRAVHGT